MRLLVSVRSLDEALVAAHGGAGFIDLKEPSNGALGGLPIDTIAGVVAALRAHGIALPISATVGEPPRAQLLDHVAAVAACGVDYVKVGITPGRGASELLDALARCGQPVVPVLIADDGIDQALLAHALTLRFAALMLDTADKRAGSLLERVPQTEVAHFVSRVRSRGVLAGLAGSLRLQDLPALLDAAPDFAGFRGAVCSGARDAALSADRLHTLVQAVAAGTHALA